MCILLSFCPSLGIAIDTIQIVSYRIMRYYCISKCICVCVCIFLFVLFSVCFSTVYQHKLFIYFLSVSEQFFLVTFWIFEQKKNQQEGVHSVFMFLRNVDTVKRISSVFQHTLNSWALSKFQFWTIPIEPRQSLQFNSRLIFSVCRLVFLLVPKVVSL